jgi:hypothetical protein
MGHQQKTWTRKKGKRKRNCEKKGSTKKESNEKGANSNGNERIFVNESVPDEETMNQQATPRKAEEGGSDDGNILMKDLVQVEMTNHTLATPPVGITLTVAATL